MEMKKLIYPDSHIWDALCDLPADPQKLMKSLASQNATLVIAGHGIYELAKTFSSKHEGRAERGIQLSKYVRNLLNAGVHGSKQLMDLVRDESYAETWATLEKQAADVNDRVGSHTSH